MRIMNAPMMGSWQVHVHAVHPFAIHGDRYYELQVLRTDDESVAGQLISLKVPEHALPGVPERGQRLSISFLMGQVTRAEPLSVR
jgi:hypothetical protein